MTDIEFLKLQVMWYNSKSKPDAEGFNCEACKNRRYFARINNEGFLALRACTCQRLIVTRNEEENETPRRRENNET